METICIHYFFPKEGENENELNGYLIPKQVNAL